MTIKKKYYAIIPARGGSTGIKNKNLLKINRKTLVSIASKFALGFKFFEKVILSSDSNKILNNVKNNRIIKDKRPKKYSGKFSQTIETVKYISKSFKFNKGDVIFLFEPTSPLRNKSDVYKVKKIIDKKSETSVCTFSESWTQPQRAWKRNKSKMSFFLKNQRNLLPRQKHSRSYSANGNVIAFKFKKNLSKIIINNTSFAMVDKLRSLDIDDISDYTLVKYIYENTRVQK